MVSLMRRFQKRHNQGLVVAKMPAKAGKAPANAGGKGIAKQNQLAAFLAASLGEDLKILSAENSHVRKAEIKRDTLIPKYAEYVAKLKEAGSDNELLGYYLVWLFDAGMIGQALEHAAWCMEKGLKLPGKFKSALPFFVAAQVATWAEGEFREKREIEPYFGEVFAKILADESAWGLPDEETARFYRLRGLKAEITGDLAAAESDLVKASDYGAQVKTALARVRRAIG